MKRYDFPNSANQFHYFYNHNAYPHIHCHNYWEITLITEGQVLHRINEEQEILHKGNICILRPDDVHALNAVKSHRNSHINLIIETELFIKHLSSFDSNFLDILLKARHNTILSSPAFITSCLNIVKRMQLTNKNDAEYSIYLRLLFLDFIREIYALRQKKTKHQAAYPEQLSELLAKMNDYNNLTKNVEEICSEINYSHSHLIRLFKEHLKTTPIKFFNDIKLNYAKNLLESSNMPIIEISMEIGYSSMGHFNVAFKKMFGLPPASYRKATTINTD